MHLLSSSDVLHYPFLILCITPRSSGTHGGTSPLCFQAVLLTGVMVTGGGAGVRGRQGGGGSHRAGAAAAHLPGAHARAGHRGLGAGRGPGQRQPPGQPRPAGPGARQVRTVPTQSVSTEQWRPSAGCVSVNVI